MNQATERPETRDDGPIPGSHRACGFNPMEFPICAQVPKRLDVPTAWVGHIPFAMGLVAMARPRVIVELGVQWGASYAAFCQAVKALRLDTRCYAVDTWEGCPHSGYFGSADFDDLRKHNEAEYALFSELIRSTFDEARPRFPDGSIDILHIDGFHSYDAVRHDFEAWLPKMSDRGVVLFHDTEVRWCESYGVWRFWDELKPRYPHFEFHQSFGLGVLAVGESVPAGLRPLLDLSEADAGRVREYFTNLGERLNELRNASLEKGHLLGQLHAKAEECARLANEVDAAGRLFGRLRFRAVDMLTRRIRHHPQLHRVLRSLAHPAAAGNGPHRRGSTAAAPRA